MSEMMQAMSGSGQWGIQNERCLYENDDVIVGHSTMNFPDGSREAVLAFHKIRDGKIISTETGATPLK